jgi:hypothetical protein
MTKPDTEPPAGGKPQNWWHTLPGVLTGVAAIITAGAGLAAALFQAGLLSKQAPQQQTQRHPAPDAIATTVGSGTPSAPAVIASAPLPQAAPAAPAARLVNLLSAENGGHLVIAGSDAWKGTIDGKEDFNQIGYGLEEASTAVFAFKERKAARVSAFSMLIPGTSAANPREVELSVATESAAGPFEPIGIFKPTNAKLFDTPYQEFRFTPVVAKYLKVRLLSTFDARHPIVNEIQLLGQPLAGSN